MSTPNLRGNRAWSQLRRSSIPALLLLGVLPATASEQCRLDGVAIEDDLARTLNQKFDEYVIHKGVELAQEEVMRRTIDQLLKPANDLDRLAPLVVPSGTEQLATLARNHTSIRQIFTFAEKFVSGDYEEAGWQLFDSAATHAAEHFATQALGMADAASVIGALKTGYDTVKQSYEQLEHESCLLRLDAAYYDFLEQPQFQYTDLDSPRAQRAVNEFLASYVIGEGEDPMGRSIATNRRTLQCYINTLPDHQRVFISSAQDRSGNAVDGNPIQIITDAFGRVTEVMSGVGVTRAGGETWTGNPSLRTATLLMFGEMNAKRAVEEERKRARRILQSREYGALETTVRAMESFPLVQDFLCSWIQESPGEAPAPAPAPRPLNEETNVQTVCRSLGEGDKWYPGYVHCCDLPKVDGRTKSRWQSADGSHSEHLNSCSSWGIKPKGGPQIAPREGGVCRSLAAGDRWYPGYVHCCDLAPDGSGREKSRWISDSGGVSEHLNSCRSWGIN